MTELQTETKVLRKSPTYRGDDPWSQDRIDSGKELFFAVLREFPTGAAFTADLARLRTMGRFHREVVEAAKVVGQSWRDVMVANISYDLAMYVIGCSTMAIATKEGPILARNLDWWPEAELMNGSECVHDTNGNVRATWPGFVGVVTGMSARGFAVALNAVGSAERASLAGYPVLLFLRKVLDDAKDFDDAVKRLSKQTLAAPALLTVVGTQNHQRVVIERTPRRSSLRWAEDHQPLVATNDYKLMDATVEQEHDLYQTACSRFKALTQRAIQLLEHESVSDLDCLNALTDLRVFQQITVQHVVARPAGQQFGVWTPSSFS